MAIIVGIDVSHFQGKLCWTVGECIHPLEIAQPWTLLATRTQSYTPIAMEQNCLILLGGRRQMMDPVIEKVTATVDACDESS